MTRIKICGLTRPEDIHAAAELGADAVGVILVPSSPRYVPLKRAKELLRKLPPFVSSVGVVRNPSGSLLEEMGASGLFSAIQFHGEESPELVASAPCKSLKALGIASAEDVHKGRRYCGYAEALLLDSRSGKCSGGTGKIFNWDLLKGIDLGMPLLLAGGLNRDNIREALEEARPWGVDLNSGVEDAPGIKNAEKMREIIGIIRDWDARQHEPRRI